ncbi:MAG: sodium:solute symporter, partial [Verrucomicrobiota bacterium]|nr:sodium:solute symporter [Verrucomicrobiota bacterium]
MNPALVSFGIYVLAVFVLAWVAGNSSSKSKSFVNEYFLGGRALGLWAFALTFATTNASGGSFIGFPAKIYTHGWVLALWIAGYMTVPFIAIGVLGKRLNYVARKVNAITLPEVLGKRFKSESVTLVATSIIVLFMFFYLMAQFKAGGMILSTLLAEEPLFINGTKFIAQFTPSGMDPEYLLTLIIFSVAVIGYVVYGGFKAVVWTDMMQGIIMFLGVAIMLVLVLSQVGGLERATRELH